MTYQTLHAQHATQAAHGAIDLGQHVRAGVVFDNFAAGDGSLARDVAFAADALASRRIDAAKSDSASSLLKFFSRGASLAVLAKVGTNLALLFRHCG